uniref:Uncharacterized protein n=1 Tax=Anguilla anguilla TaxID=7936 RepID=A0A0E9UU40_ANGAN
MKLDCKRSSLCQIR